MAVFLYRCPNTGSMVQGYVVDDEIDEGTFHPITCSACTRVHLVDPKTGEVLGVDNK